MNVFIFPSPHFTIVSTAPFTTCILVDLYSRKLFTAPLTLTTGACTALMGTITSVLASGTWPQFQLAALFQLSLVAPAHTLWVCTSKKKVPADEREANLPPLNELGSDRIPKVVVVAPKKLSLLLMGVNAPPADINAQLALLP